MITHDRSERSIVTVCSGCGARDVHVTQGAADSWHVAHLYRAHSSDDPSADRSRAVASAAARRRRDTP